MHQKFLDQEFRVLNVCVFLAASCETLDGEQQQQSSLVTLLLFVSLLVLGTIIRGEKGKEEETQYYSQNGIDLAGTTRGADAGVARARGRVRRGWRDGSGERDVRRYERSQIIFSRESLLCYLGVVILFYTTTFWSPRTR